MPRLFETQYLIDENLTKEEISWLEKVLGVFFSKRITESDIAFDYLGEKNINYFLCPQTTDTELGNDSIPDRFLQNEWVISTVNDADGGNFYYIIFELVYWFFGSIQDILDFKDSLDKIFTNSRADKSYSLSQKGYKLYHKHFIQANKKWTAIDKCLLLGFAIFLDLFQRVTRKSLKRMYEGFKDLSLEYVGLTRANREAFGKADLYAALGLCWHCGMIKVEVKAKGLCWECGELWDRWTK